MFDFSKPFGNASLVLLVSAALHIVVIAVTLGDHFMPMIVGAVLWTFCAFALQWGSRWIAGLVFLIVILMAATIPLAYALTATGLASIAFWGIVLTDLVAALMLFVALWRPKEEASRA